MNFIRASVILFVAFGGSVIAQTASFSADGNKLATGGGQVTLTAAVAYEGEPGALGWSVALPESWSFAGVVGPNVPAIVPEAGSTGTLEFAFTAVPAHRAEFSILVRYPAGATPASATPMVLLRSAGKLTTLKPAVVNFQATP